MEAIKEQAASSCGTAIFRHNDLTTDIFRNPGETFTTILCQTGLAFTPDKRPLPVLRVERNR